MHLHLEEIILNFEMNKRLKHTRIERYDEKHIGWYECVNCSRRYIPTTLKRFIPSHIAEGG